MTNNLFDEIDKFLTSIRIEFLRRSAGPLTKGSITIPQMILLEILYRRNMCIMKELAKEMGITTSAVTGLADRLIRSGLISRTRGLEDRRLVIVSLTEKGKNSIRKLISARHAMVKKAFSGLNQSEQKLYLNLLRKIYSGLVKK